METWSGVNLMQLGLLTIIQNIFRITSAAKLSLPVFFKFFFLTFQVGVWSQQKRDRHAAANILIRNRKLFALRHFSQNCRYPVHRQRWGNDWHFIWLLRKSSALHSLKLDGEIQGVLFVQGDCVDVSPPTRFFQMVDRNKVDLLKKDYEKEREGNVGERKELTGLSSRIRYRWKSPQIPNWKWSWKGKQMACVALEKALSNEKIPPAVLEKSSGSGKKVLNAKKQTARLSHKGLQISNSFGEEWFKSAKVWQKAETLAA